MYDISVPIMNMNIKRGDREYSQIEFINCDGRMGKDKVYLSYISPFGFVAFEVR